MAYFFKRYRNLTISLVIILTICITCLRLVGFITSVYSLTVITVMVLCFVWFSLLLFIPNEYGKKKLRQLSLYLISGGTLFTLWVFKNGSLINSFKKKIVNIYPQLDSFASSYELSVIVIILTGLLLLILLHYIIRDFSAMKTHENSFDEEFPEKEFKNRVVSFCKFLKVQLDHLDIDTNWSDAHFTPLEAEVEVQSGNKKKKKVTNLLSAIKKDNKSNTFLVLGDPGSGKSVALRKLSRDLLKEVPSTYKIPIYINLKEWKTLKKWSELDPPTYNDLNSFIVSNLKGKDVFADEFIDKYYNRLFENGHLFFILDSFDEIPAVLDENESSWLIDKLSEIIYNFLAGAHDSRGILASRIFRRPSARFQTKTILDIRPFSELQIEQALKKYISFDHQLIKELFSDRQELIPIASNPFSVGLIYNYAKDNNNSLPRTQAELYSSYINKRLNACKDKSEKKGLNNNTIVKAAIDIANFMFEKTNLGLEASVTELKKEFSTYPIDEIIEILTYARIGRLGIGDEKRFSFVHRRFNEYFVVQKMIINPDAINLEAIPSDSRYRDALVLYCEVAEFSEAVRIAEYCWNEIKQISDVSINETQYLRAIHCLRFIKEAYRTRLNCLEPFIRDLGELVQKQIKKHSENGNILFTKLAIEAVGLLSPIDINKIIMSAFALNNPWIDETAVKSCRYLPKIDKELENRVLLYINTFDTKTFYSKKDELLFSLKLSDGFSRIYKLCRLKQIDNVLLIIGLFLLLFLNPIALFVVLLCIRFEPYISFVIIPTKLLSSIVNGTNDIKKHISKRDEGFSILLGIWRIYVSMYLISACSSSGFSNIFFLPNVLNVHSFNFNNGAGIVVSSLLLLCILFLLPVYNFCIVVKLVTLNMKREIFKNVIRTVVVGGVVLWLFTVVLKDLFDNKTFQICIYIIAGLSILFTFIMFLYYNYLDYKNFKKVKAFNHNSREMISISYKKFNTSYFRLQYILHIENTVEKGVGDWPENKMPFENEESGILLAKLEEKWLGLNR
ncbi:MAG: putative NTPase family [Bacteroidetes bacterium]|nr:putative NTPase family [Bacteroidota bacterium]